MFCTKCGTKKVNENDKFCRECGAAYPDVVRESTPENFSGLPVGQSSVGNMTTQSSMNTTNNYSYKQPMPPLMSQPKKSNKLPIILATLSVCFAVVVIFLLFQKTESPIFQGSGSGDSSRTMMIYMVGSDLESEHVAASTDIQEMLQSNADFENINLLIYTGGAKRWHMEGIPNDKNAIFRVTSSGLEKLEEYPITAMGNSSTLTSFLEYAYENYKADEYSLILWNHGGGPIYGYGLDEHYSGNQLTLMEIEAALDDSPFNGKNKLEFIGFDACLMASAEIAYSISPYADYMIASQEVEPGAGWDYVFLGDITKDTSTINLGKSIVDSFYSYYVDQFNYRGISLSIVDLSKMNEFEENLNALFEEIDDNLTFDFSKISRSRSDSKTFGQTAASDYDLVDVYDLVENLPDDYSKEAQDLQQTIKEAVVYQKTDLIGTNGISLYFPYSNKTRINQVLYTYKTFGFADGYSKFIDNFSGKLTGTRLFNWNLEKQMPTVEQDGDISVVLPDEVVNNYSSANYTIFEKVDDEYYMPRFKGTDVQLSGNKLSTSASKKALVLIDEEGKEFYLTTYESDKGTDYVIYNIPGILQRWDDEFDEDDIISVDLRFVVDDENPKGYVAGAVLINDDDDENGMFSSKVVLDIKQWDFLELFSSKYKIFDENGNYTKEWVSSGILTGVSVDTDENFTLEFKDLNEEKEYYCVFRVLDSQGNEYTTNVVKIEM